MKRFQCPGDWTPLQRLAYGTGPPDPYTGCMEWQRGKNADGFGAIHLPGRKVSAHQISLEIKLGRPLAADEAPLHTCANPPCVNPDHLYAGVRQNMSHSRGRKKVEWAARVMEMHTQGYNRATIVRETGVGWRTVGNWIAEYSPPDPRTRELARMRKESKKLFAEGMIKADIARKLGTYSSNVKRWVTE